MRIDFTLKDYLKHPRRKVITGASEPVRIICVDKPGEYPVVFYETEVSHPMPFVANEKGMNPSDMMQLYFLVPDPKFKVGDFITRVGFSDRRVVGVDESQMIYETINEQDIANPLPFEEQDSWTLVELTEWEKSIVPLLGNKCPRVCDLKATAVKLLNALNAKPDYPRPESVQDERDEEEGLSKNLLDLPEWHKVGYLGSELKNFSLDGEEPDLWLYHGGYRIRVKDLVEKLPGRNKLDR